MTAEIIAVGTELLLGDIVNTNAQYLAQELAQLGVSVYFQTVVGDNPQRLEQVIQQAQKRSDLLIFTGGLGPTQDDLTKETVANVFGDPLQFDEKEWEKIQSFFEKRGLIAPESNRKQAYIPAHGMKLNNFNGTAPGMIFQNQFAPQQYAILLPGPPKEMKPMFESRVKPWLKERSDSVLHSLTLRVMGMGESEIEQKTAALLNEENPTAALYAKTGEVVIRITAGAKDRQTAQKMCEKTACQFYEILGDVIYTQTEHSLEETLIALLKKQKQTLATAESCTGGLLSQRLTSISGASAVLEAGICTYSNQQKRKLLNVSQQTLAQFGAVSAQTAIEMAQGVQKHMQTDFGVSITGIAGPTGGTPEKPVGLVYVAVCDEKQVAVKRLMLVHLTRENVRWVASQYALEMVRRMALKLPQLQCQVFETSKINWQE